MSFTDIIIKGSLVFSAAFRPNTEMHWYDLKI